jgi:hypothetical protein
MTCEEYDRPSHLKTWSAWALYSTKYQSDLQREKSTENTDECKCGLSTVYLSNPPFLIYLYCSYPILLAESNNPPYSLKILTNWPPLFMPSITQCNFCPALPGISLLHGKLRLYSRPVVTLLHDAHPDEIGVSRVHPDWVTPTACNVFAACMS